MKRRTFFKTTALATPVIISGCMDAGKISADADPLLEKVITAMLSMQRASWEQGVAAQSLLELGREDLSILMAREAVLRQLPDGRLSVVYTDNGVTDPAASGTAVLRAGRTTGDPELEKAADRMKNFLMTTDRRTEDGILYHTLNSDEIWIDSMYMAPPFLAETGEYAEAVKQIEGFRSFLWNGEKRLYSHRWHCVKKEFISADFWGVGNGWALAGISRVIDLLPVEYSADRDRLISYLGDHLESILKYMTEEGLFHNVVDRQETFLEANLSQMIAYTIYTGIASGWLGDDLLISADHMRNAAREKVDQQGFVTGVCGAPYFNAPGRATEGQAFFVLMEAARNKMIG